MNLYGKSLTKELFDKSDSTPKLFEMPTSLSTNSTEPRQAHVEFML